MHLNRGRTRHQEENCVPIKYNGGEYEPGSGESCQKALSIGQEGVNK